MTDHGGAPGVPAAWLVMNRALLPASGDALDVACGGGRNAIWLAGQGFATTAVDRDAATIAALNERARTAALPLRAVVMDLEGAVPPPLGDAGSFVQAIDDSATTAAHTKRADAQFLTAKLLQPIYRVIEAELSRSR